MPVYDNPSYGGYPIFGVAVLFDGPVPNPVDLQINAYPGVSGLNAISLGGRGGVTTVTGTLVAATPADMLASEQIFRDFQQSATANLLIDDLGEGWFGVVLIGYRRTSRQWVDAAGFVSVDYEATFLHLII